MPIAPGALNALSAYQSQNRLNGTGVAPTQRLAPGAANGLAAYQTASRQPGIASPTPFNSAGQPTTGLLGSEDALRRGYYSAGQSIQGGVDQAGQALGGYMQGGNAAFDLQSALTGALGQPAQQQAYNNYMESPGTQFLRDEGERAITRNAAAIGGLGSGNVQRELAQYATGLAAQDFDNSFNRLSQVSDMGYGASNFMGGLQANAGMQMGQYGMQNGAAMSQGRTRAGEQMSSNIGGTTSALANLLNQQGQGYSDTLGQYGGNLAGLLQGAGQGSADSGATIQALLAQLSQGTGNQIVGLNALGGTPQEEGALKGIGQAAAGTAALFALSDRRLKKNITKVGKTPGGTNLYTWDWVVPIDQSTFGVIAQEVPEAAFEGADGFLRVDYSKVV